MIDQHADLVARWKTLSELSQAVNGYRSVEDLFHDLAGRLHDLLNFTYLSVVLHEESIDRMRVWQIEGAEMEPYAERPGIRVEDSPSGKVWQTQQALVIGDTLVNGEFPVIEQILASVNVRSFISLPLTTVHRRLGALNFGNSAAHVYDDVDLELPLLVASHIAIAVDNALHADAARELEKHLRDRNVELSAERQRLQEIVHEIPGIVWEVEGLPLARSSKLSLLNDAIAGILGYDLETIKKKPRMVLNAVHREDRLRLVRHLDQHAKGLPTQELIVRAQRRGGETRWIEIRCTLTRSAANVRVGLRGVAMDVTGRIQHEAERRTHLAQLVAERLQERARIAADLHDTLLQSAIGSSLRLHMAAERIGTRNAEVRADLEAALTLLDEAVSEARKAVQGLRTNDNDEDLEESLRRTAAQLQMEQPALFNLAVSGGARRIDSVMIAGLKRIAVEALTNAYRHARATRIDAQVDYGSDHIRLCIRDNGVGIDPQFALRGKPGHLGMVAMRERAEMFGGSLRVLGDSNGTSVEVLLPTDYVAV